MTTKLGGADGAPRQCAWNGAVTGYPDDATIVELFARQVDRAPDAIAVAGGGRQLTYAELAAWSDRLAAHLLAAGVRAGEFVGLLGERGLTAPVGMLGILKAGGVYVPLDRADPVARLRMLVDELAISRTVTMPGCGGLLDRVPGHAVADTEAGPAVSPPPIDADGGAAAYVMFTSGSTGTPKGVAVPHRAVARLVVDTDFVRITPADSVANTGHHSFDASVFEIWGALLNGARLVIVEQETLLDPHRLASALEQERISVLWLSAGVFHQCARAIPTMFRDLRCLISGGDVLLPDLVREVLRAGAPGSLINGYGPTENTTFSTTHRVTAVPAGTARVPIGRPIANSTCYVVRADGSLADVAEEGEIVVGGDGVALGYVNHPELTAERFVPDPYGRRPGARLFRTGDRGRWLPEGVLDFLGRTDRMIKLRDFRIELDEVEAVLATHPQLGAAAVTTTGDHPLTRTMVAFYTPRGTADAPTPGELRAFLAQQLPAFMLPGRYLPVQRLPLTATGKVDRALLERGTGGVAPPAARPGRRPETPVQVGLAQLWTETLDVDEVTLDDSFFELGGNSLLAARVFARLRDTFGIAPEQGRFLTRRLLADPSLEACAEAVQQARINLLRHDEVGHDVDFQREAALTVPVRVEPSAPDPDGEVLLTGATGFLGSYLLRELLNATRARVHCLVRAPDVAGALHRLSAAQRRYGLGDLPRDRVVPLVGDLGLPLLGLAEEAFDRYARELGLIMHAAAYVNFTYPYAHLAKVTVAGTREVIRLAGRHRGVPVHFVSTLAVLAGFAGTRRRVVTEDLPPAYPERLYMGYPETKWVAETMLRHAADAGLPVSVYRPYEISGDLRDGQWNLESATCALFRIIADTGAVPDIDLPLDLVPVDLLARQMVHIARTRTAATSTYHLANDRPAMLADMADRLRAHGYPVRTLPLDRWVADAVRLACDRPEHPFTPFIPLWVDRSPASGLVVKQMYFGSLFPEFGRDNARAALAGADLELPPVDAGLLDHYVRYFQRCGFLPPPPGRD